MQKFDYTLKNDRKTIKYKQRDAIKLNLKYPVFSSSAKSEKDIKFCEKLNSFYQKVNTEYMSYFVKKPSKTARLSEKSGVLCSFVANCNVSYSDAEYISVFSDISFYDGKEINTERFSQLWSYSKNAILPVKYIFRTESKIKAYVKDCIYSIAKENMKAGSFTYFDNLIPLINRHFSYSNSYFVPRGVAFFFLPKILSYSDKICTFVVPFDKMLGVLKIDIPKM